MGSKKIWLCKKIHRILYPFRIFILIGILLASLFMTHLSFYTNSDHHIHSGYDTLSISVCATSSQSLDQEVDNGLRDASNDSTNMLTKKIFSDSSDGYSKFFGAANVDTWSYVRNNRSGNQKNDSCVSYTKGILASYNAKTGDLYVISRSYFAFNTTILGANASIKNATLYIYGVGTNESSVCMVGWEDGTDGVDFDDYGAIGQINLGKSDSWHINRYNQLPFNEQGRTYLNKTGYTYIACREYDHDFLDIPPKGEGLDENRNGHYYTDEPGTDKDPYLLIEYYSDISDDENDAPDETPLISMGILLFLIIGFALIFKLKNK